MTDTQEWLNSAGGDRNPSFSFKEKGAKIAGTISSSPRIVNTDDLNGGHSDKLVLDVTTDEGQTYAVWIKAGGMASAVRAAVNEAGVKRLEEGGRFALAYVSDGEQTKPGFNPPKVYKAKYEAPKGGVDVDDLF